jgi:4-hydroxythreonine-4-phosphate dehydrogenase
MKRRPTVGITMGDAAGIGPEIIAKCLMDGDIYEICRPLVIGDADVLEGAVAMLGSRIGVRSIGTEGAPFVAGAIYVLDLGNLTMADFEPGRISVASGRASFQYIERAVELALAGRLDAVATAPINKEALNRAGFHYPGHTEILADLTGCDDYAMMLVSGPLRVIHVTTHISLREACASITKGGVLRAIALSQRAARDLGFASPRIAIAGLNPHAGEGGLFGEEEITEISPAIEEAKMRGTRASGPYPPDTIFLRASRGEFDVVVAMYHDQGHIAVKMLGLEGGVNVTIGLPIVRTSVDHGTAYDIAWRGLADYRSMRRAIQLAAEMADRKSKA